MPFRSILVPSQIMAVCSRPLVEISFPIAISLAACVYVAWDVRYTRRVTNQWLSPEECINCILRRRTKSLIMQCYDFVISGTHFTGLSCLARNVHILWFVGDQHESHHNHHGIDAIDQSMTRVVMSWSQTPCGAQLYVTVPSSL